MDQDRETLLSHIKNGVCFNCISQKTPCEKNNCCQIDKIKNGDRYGPYITNALNINSNIKNCGKKFDKKKQFSICKRINEDCKNCIDGRFDTFENDGKICFYCFNEYSGKMYIYLHCDIELVGSRCSPKIIPLENIYINRNINEEKNVTQNNYNEDKQNSFLSEHKCSDKLNVVKELVEEDNFPALNNSKVNIKPPLEYSKILKDLAKNVSNIETPIILNDNNENDDKNTIDKNVNLSSDNLIKDECNFLKTENIFLNEKILKLKLEIKTIKDQLTVSLKKEDNKKIYQEMEFNENEINTSVTKTFMNTHYSEYKIF